MGETQKQKKQDSVDFFAWFDLKCYFGNDLYTDEEKVGIQKKGNLNIKYKTQMHNKEMLKTF